MKWKFILRIKLSHWTLRRFDGQIQWEDSTIRIRWDLFWDSPEVKWSESEINSPGVDRHSVWSWRLKKRAEIIWRLLALSRQTLLIGCEGSVSSSPHGERWHFQIVWFELFGRNFQFEVLRLMLLRFGPSNLRFSKMWNPHVHWTALNGIDPVENSTKFNRAFGKLAWQLSKSVIWELQCGFLFGKECSDPNVLLNCKSHEMLGGSRN